MKEDVVRIGIGDRVTAATALVWPLLKFSVAKGTRGYVMSDYGDGKHVGVRWDMGPHDIKTARCALDLMWRLDVMWRIAQAHLHT